MWDRTYHHSSSRLNTSLKLNASLIAMDFRRVEPRFKKAGCLFQIVLLTGLVVYIVSQILLIISLAEDPPVHSSWKQWDGAGRWAICSNELQGAGVGIFNRTGFVNANDWVDHLSGPSGWKLLAAEEAIGVHSHCAIVDLSSWRWPQPDTTFCLCGFAPHRGGENFAFVHFYVWSANHWKHVTQFAPTVNGQMQLEKRVHRHNHGHKTESQEVFSSIPLSSSWASDHTITPHYPGPCAVWSNLSAIQPETRQSYIRVLISSEHILVTTVQGFLPQLFDVFSKVGGYLALLTLIFNMVFVKMYPDSGVSQVYEARTFIGKPIIKWWKGEGKEDKKSIAANAPAPLTLPPGMFKDLDTE